MQQQALCHYRYDPLDRLDGVAPAGEVQVQVLHFYQKSRLATQVQGALRYSVFQQGDQLLAQQQRSGATAQTTLLATDPQRSVLQMLTSGQREAKTYTAYGHHRPAESGLSSLLGFNGQRRDPVTGHYLLGNGYRAFNPVLMRFNSPDSFSPFGAGGLNGYAYCQEDPVNFGDPSGHIFINKNSPFASRSAFAGTPLNMLPRRDSYYVGVSGPALYLQRRSTSDISPSPSTSKPFSNPAVSTSSSNAPISGRSSPTVQEIQTPSMGNQASASLRALGSRSEQVNALRKERVVLNGISQRVDLSPEAAAKNLMARLENEQGVLQILKAGPLPGKTKRQHRDQLYKSKRTVKELSALIRN